VEKWREQEQDVMSLRSYNAMNKKLRYGLNAPLVAIDTFSFTQSKKAAEVKTRIRALPNDV
jgi:hypothetical protein